MLAVFVCGSQCWQLCTCKLTRRLWQDSVQIPYHHLSHHSYVNLAVSGGDVTLVRKLVADD